jgi:hypothetical protein
LLVVGIRAFPGTKNVNIQGDRGAVVLSANWKWFATPRGSGRQ